MTPLIVIYCTYCKLPAHQYNHNVQVMMAAIAQDLSLTPIQDTPPGKPFGKSLELDALETGDVQVLLQNFQGLCGWEEEKEHH